MLDKMALGYFQKKVYDILEEALKGDCAMNHGHMSKKMIEARCLAMFYLLDNSKRLSSKDRQDIVNALEEKFSVIN